MRRCRLLWIGLLGTLFCLMAGKGLAENGYDLWLRYTPVKDPVLLKEYTANLSGVVTGSHSATVAIAVAELQKGIRAMTGTVVRNWAAPQQKDGLIVLGRLSDPATASLFSASDARQIGAEGYLIKTIEDKGRTYIVIAANKDIGLLYGSFHLLRLMQTRQHLTGLSSLAIF